MSKVLPFTKMQGLGNDYVYINCFKETVENPEDLALWVSDRHFGIGSDGLVLIMPSEKADLRMRMFNADGSEAEMCGNASRCVAKYAADHDLVKSTNFTLETGAGIKNITLLREEGEVVGATVDMGEPILEPELIPIDPKLSTQKPAKDLPLAIDEQVFKVTCVSMGNPHAVTFVDDVENLDLATLGPKFEHHHFFPKRINTEFVQVLDATRLKMRVWERGAGETLACGTGACAAMVAAVLNGLTQKKITMSLRGGDLTLEWAKNNHVLMTGKAVTVFDGILYLD